MAAVVDEPGVLRLLDRRPGADGVEPPGERRTATGRVDDEVGDHLFAGLGADADNVRYAGQGRSAGEESGHGDTAADLEARRRLGEAGHDRFEHRAATGDGFVDLVTRPE